MKPYYTEVDGKKIAIVAASRAEKYKMTPQATDTTPGILRCYDTELFVQTIKEARANADYVVAVVHWGTEHTTVLEDVQRSSAREYIDAGADVIIGGHSHCLQGIEYYEDKPIFYSLGNFCFGGNSTPGDTDSMIVQQTFTFHKGKLKKSSKLNIIPCSITSSSGYNDYCPVPLTGDEKQRVLDKISQYSEEL